MNNVVPNFFEDLEYVLSTTSKRTMANYFMWRIILQTCGTLTEDLRKLKMEFIKTTIGLQAEKPRWKECAELTSQRYTELTHEKTNSFANLYFHINFFIFLSIISS